MKRCTVCLFSRYREPFTTRPLPGGGTVEPCLQCAETRDSYDAQRRERAAREARP